MTPRYLLPAHVFQRGFAEERVLLDMQSGDYFALNASGAWMLDALLEGDSLERVAERTSEQFEVELKQAESDLLALIEDMSARGLLISISVQSK